MTPVCLTVDCMSDSAHILFFRGQNTTRDEYRVQLDCLFAISVFENAKEQLLFSKGTETGGKVWAVSNIITELHYSDVLIRGGNAVDSAIATAVCVGAAHPHNSGFGGGMNFKVCWSSFIRSVGWRKRLLQRESLFICFTY
ncbi:unnamed protein product [Angiostrongylus costaricensis]|uniref:Gamma-glutamyltranspeptidase n=1 Tax=Angiostrongylus costaricensis TaxID=334426 RepID=A0A0R3Q122_ANGCS|nr:unnamed protein product [Angiostrongylus costaricensis]